MSREASGGHLIAGGATAAREIDLACIGVTSVYQPAGEMDGGA